MSLIAGMLARADNIDDMNRNRTGGMKHLATSVYAPSTLGQFLRKFTFGHVRALQTACDQSLQRLASRADFFPTRNDSSTPADEMVFVDIDDTVIAVHSARKQGSGHGYTGVRGLNGLLAVASTTSSQPVIIGNRLRKGAVHSARGAKKFTQDALSTVGRLPGVAGKRVVLAADSAFTTTKNPVTGRLVVRRIPEKNQKELAKAGQEGLFTVWRYHAVFTTIPADVLDTVQADKAHRRHAVIDYLDVHIRSSKSTPSSRPGPSKICPPEHSTPTPPGSLWPAWPTTSPARGRSWPGADYRSQGPQHCGPSSSASRPASPATREESFFTCQPIGPRRPSSAGSGTPCSAHRPRWRTDHPAQTRARRPEEV